jgi:hypothetical protein
LGLDYQKYIFGNRRVSCKKYYFFAVVKLIPKIYGIKNVVFGNGTTFAAFEILFLNLHI